MTTKFTWRNSSAMPALHAGWPYVDVYPGIDLEITSVGGKWDWRPVARTLRTTERLHEAGE